MKITILVHEYGGYPFAYHLSKGLAAKGYSVMHVYNSASGSPGGDFKESENLHVLDLGKGRRRVNKNSFIQRYWQENDYGNLIARKIRELKPALVISGNTPLEAEKKMVRVCGEEGIYLIHWLQDILSIAAEKILYKRNRLLAKLIGIYFHNIEKKCLCKADHVVAICDDFAKILLDWGVNSDRISVIENWANITEMPVVAKQNSFSVKYGLTDTFNLVYTGTLGMKQNPDLLLELAEIYRSRINVRFVVVATGSGVRYVKEQGEKRRLDNLLVLPLQPFSELPNVLGCGDMLMSMLDSDASIYCVPSKVLTYYCAGRPSLQIMSKDNLAAQITLRNELGFVVEPGDLKSLIDVIDSAIQNSPILTEYGLRARAYAEEHFDLDKVAQQFLPIIRNAIS